MKKSTLQAILLLFCFSTILAQNEFNDWVAPNFVSTYERLQSSPSKSPLSKSSTYVEIVSIAVDSGTSTLLPGWYDDLMNELPNYSGVSTFRG